MYVHSYDGLLAVVVYTLQGYLIYSVSRKNEPPIHFALTVQTRPVLNKLKHAHVQRRLGYCYKMVSQMSVTTMTYLLY